MTDLVLTPSPGAVIVEIDDEAIVVDEWTGHLHLLNPQAALVWACLDGSSTIGEICADLAECVGVPHAEVERDVSALAMTLLDVGLVSASRFERHGPEAPSEAGCCCGEMGEHSHDERSLPESPNI